ncbi:2-hydroxyacid dehydrogenase [Burkholderia guangdongensis]|uniref:2-hydroxyacid dehydrogenase n=1 Tax=Burkholderia guangdongensis TaxID=1792500 RepID=UPI0015C76DE8|nr:glyoxylate/hydroxypyruvate reductase A [Burkholderia guangdongensis]
MTTIVLLSKSTDLSFLISSIQRSAPELDVVTHDDPRARDAEIAVCWEPPEGALAALPKLRLIQGIAAGVDNILSDPTLPRLPVCRIVDPQHARGMSEFVTWAALHYMRQLDVVLRNQRDAVWFRPKQAHPSQCSVGIMGLGEIGKHVAAELHRLGFAVRGWARQARDLPGIEVFAGADNLGAFLAGTDILVCLLPLTNETRGMLDAKTFGMLKAGAKLIHVGRGEHLVVPDLVAALDSGQLGGAIVDVFPVEPLPADDPLWRTPNLIVTPHMASVASPKTMAEQIAENARRLVNGEPLLNVVDVARGY